MAAVSLATSVPYEDVYRELMKRQRRYFARRGKSVYAIEKLGTMRPVYESYLLERGWSYKQTLFYKNPARVYLGELPALGTLVVSLRMHLCTVIDNVLYDSRAWEIDRPVYGYYMLDKR